MGTVGAGFLVFRQVLKFECVTVLQWQALTTVIFKHHRTEILSRLSFYRDYREFPCIPFNYKKMD